MDAQTSGGDFDYRGLTAQLHADRAARRPKTSKLANNSALRDYVQDWLAGQTAKLPWVSPTSDRKHRDDGPQANHALTQTGPLDGRTLESIAIRRPADEWSKCDEEDA